MPEHVLSDLGGIFKDDSPVSLAAGKSPLVEWRNCKNGKWERRAELIAPLRQSNRDN